MGLPRENDILGVKLQPNFRMCLLSETKKIEEWCKGSSSSPLNGRESLQCWGESLGAVGREKQPRAVLMSPTGCAVPWKGKTDSKGVQGGKKWWVRKESRGEEEKEILSHLRAGQKRAECQERKLKLKSDGACKGIQAWQESIRKSGIECGERAKGEVKLNM